MRLAGYWKRLGRVYSTEQFLNNDLSNAMHQGWMSSHSAVPIIQKIDDSRFEMYFTVRDSKQRSNTAKALGRFINDQFIIESVGDAPIIQPGQLGCFDDSGAMGSWITRGPDGVEYFYYIGWNIGTTVPFRNSIGLAKKVDNEFVKLFEGPILDRTKTEPHFCASSCVLVDQSIWKMWYLSCTVWQRDPESGAPIHRYHIKYAESDDGIDWKREGQIAIDFKDDEEVAISRPCVVKLNDSWHMWFSYRSKHSTYKIGYAHSDDGILWHRDDEHASLAAHGDGWESDMVEYPYVFNANGRLYMVYNGNGYGQSGIGLAEWRLESA